MKYTVWTSSYIYDDQFLNEIKEYMQENGLVPSENDVFEEAVRINHMYLEDTRMNLNIPLDNEIIAIADLGLWDGHHKGYKVYPNNIERCLYSDYEPEWFVDGNGDFRAVIGHHDGTNYILYREFKDISENQKKAFINKVLNDKVTSRDITRYTRRIGNKIADVYGWQVRNYGNQKRGGK